MEAELRVCEQYVVGMLTNIGAQPAARILNMIKMFTPAEQEAPTEQNVQRLLAKMVEEGKLELQRRPVQADAAVEPRRPRAVRLPATPTYCVVTYIPSSTACRAVLCS